MSKEKLEKLRAALKDEKLDGFIVPRADEYQNEFVAPYAERLKWLTGFTGSGGCAVVLKDKAVVLTDGRYLIQVKNQVDPACFETGDITKVQVWKWLAEHARTGNIIGYDPMLLTFRQLEKIEKQLEDTGVILKPADNAVDCIWGNQPPPPAAPVYLFPEKLAGRSMKQKLKDVSARLKEQKFHACILTLPDSIAWLLNIRGQDTDYIPQALSRLIVRADGTAEWFIEPGRVSEEIHSYLGKKMCIYLPDALERRLEELQLEANQAGQKIALDFSRSSVWFGNKAQAAEDFKDPCIDLKACKTGAEQDSIKQAHIHDGVALVKFLYWLEQKEFPDKKVKQGNITERDVVEKLEEFRSENSAYKGPSFPTISGFGGNGAIVHYRAGEHTNTALEQGNLLLVDSGGQYLSDAFAGTTDITRTVAIGSPEKEMRESFTRVLKGHIGLARAKFPEGTNGAQIDTLARAPLWEMCLDFAHGTGHGVGCFLAVHEEAASISGRGQEPFKPGMLISNEPGYYKENQYGIRTENLVLVVEAGTCSDTGKKMLGFETVSLAPIDLTLVDAELLSREEKNWLNAYHQQVFDRLSPHLEGPVKNWLKQRTEAIL